MRKITGRGQSAGLLEPEQANDVPRPQEIRPQMYAETAHIPEPVLEDTANDEAGEPFFRARQRVPVRRRGGSGFLSRFGWKSRWVRLGAALIAVALLGLLVGGFLETKSLLLHDHHFVLRSTRNIQVTGNRVVASSQVLALFAPDAGRTIFRAPIAKRQTQLEQIRWVRRATVMRLWPDHLSVHIVERTPIAFARDGNAIRLVDDEGVLLDLSDAAAQHYSFPILAGVSSSDPLLTRASRMAMYRQFVQALDAEGGHISATLSQVDLSDSEDVRAIFTGAGRQPTVHFGTSDFLPRYRAYSAHLAEWLQQYPQLRSVDMRYGRQVVLDTGTAPQPTAAPHLSAPAIGPIAPDAKKTSPVHPLHPVHPVITSRAAPVKSKTKAAARKKSVTVKHHATKHKTTHKRTEHRTERGHPVRNPIMHVVAGA